MSVRGLSSAALIAFPALVGVLAAGDVGAAPAGSGWANVPGGATGPSETARPIACPRTKPRLRCPDLVMSAPYRLHLDRTSIRGHVLLRAASSIDSLGSGPMELSFHRSGSHMTAYQAIYDVRGRRRMFPS